jgi:zinc/manganese transport system substrate-binding protein
MKIIMKNIIPILGLATLLGAMQPAQAALNVVATLPDYGAIAVEIGGDKVKVTNLAKGTEDPHFVDARPSFIRVLNQADVLLEGGAEMEVGWLPALVNNARNPRILGDSSGHVLMARGIQLLDVPAGAVDRSMGDVHPGGNPHYAHDPANGRIMAAHLAEVFSKLDPANAATYAANLQRFNERLEVKIEEWTRRMAPYRGTKVVTYHKSYEYFAARFGLKVVGQIEPKPGIEPSPTHVNALIPRMKQEGAKLVLIEPNRPRKTPEYVAQSLGAKLVIIPGMVGGNEKIKDYFDLFDYDVAQITAALKDSK